MSDLRYAFRALVRSPAFTCSALLALALGIGANTAVFSAVYAVMLKPLPYQDADRLVAIAERNTAENVDQGVASAGTFVDWRSRSRLLEAIAVYAPLMNGETIWDLGGRSEVVRTAGVSPSLFSLLGVQPIVGAGFRDEYAEPPAGALGQLVISYGLWQRAFGGASDTVGRTITLEGRLPRQIVGVMPPGFDFPERTDAWTSVPLPNVAPAQRRNRSFLVVGRMRPHVTLAELRRELDGLSAQFAAENPASNTGWTADVEPFAGSDVGPVRFALLALMAAVAGVLLIGCANVANLLLARAVGRTREVAVRIAIGAGIWHLARLVLAEAVLLAVGGVAAGLLLGTWLATVLVRLAPPDIPRLEDVQTSGAVFVFAAAAGVAATVFTALLPALQAARASRRGGIRADVRTATGRSATVRRWLVASEAAIVVLLLTGAMLLVRTFVKLRNVDLGFNTEQVAEVETRWPIGTLFGTGGRGQQWPRVQRAVDGLIDAVASIPGVQAAGVISDVPLSGGSTAASAWRLDAPGAHDLNPPIEATARWTTDVQVVSAGYFAALRIPIVRGRNFTRADRFSDDQLVRPDPSRRGVVIVNAAFASRYFPGEDPVGHTIVLPDLGTFAAVRTIVGVAADVRGRAVAEAAGPTAYVPHAQNPDVFRPSLVVRSAMPFGPAATAIRQRIAAYDPSLLVLRIRPMDDVVSGALSRPRFNLLLLSSFAIVALALSAIGIYGVLAYLVTQRTREIGIRIALGARPNDVLGLLVREGMLPVAAGACAGTIASLLFARAIRTLLFGVTPLDAVSLAGAPVLLAAVALVACYLPARRALRVDPLVALRDE
jgi:putative ABC transport system permease protein